MSRLIRSWPWSDWLFTVAIGVYFIMNVITILMAGVATGWYFGSKGPVGDWDDPEGPGYRVRAVTATDVEVEWIQVRLVALCPARTEVTVIGASHLAHIETYPILVDEQRRTFVRHYALPPGLPPGSYQLRLTHVAQCNPLFNNRQTIYIPFEIPAR